MTDVNARVQAVLDDLIARDLERGLQVAAYLDGQILVDAWAGVADPATGRPVDGQTLFCVFHQQGHHRHRHPPPGRARPARI